MDAVDPFFKDPVFGTGIAGTPWLIYLAAILVVTAFLASISNPFRKLISLLDLPLALLPGVVYGLFESRSPRQLLNRVPVTFLLLLATGAVVGGAWIGRLDPRHLRMKRLALLLLAMAALAAWWFVPPGFLFAFT